MLALIPSSQRRSLDELDERLDFTVGDTGAKRSAFWLMLVLSGTIAVCGVVADSTATVIGAMIVAPLSTPILGVGLGIVTARGSLVLRSTAMVLVGAVLVIALGALVAQALPVPTNVLSNSQVLGRTSPTIVDLFAALATGVVGAIAITRRDVGDVLPGVAIAISLVPPLGVVGVCLGSDAPSLALGALVLFASNVVAMIITGVIVLTAAGYGAEAASKAADPSAASESDTAAAPKPWRQRRAYIVLAIALVVVAVPMVGNSLSTLLTQQVTEAASSWLSDGGVEHAEVTDVSWSGTTVTINILGPQDLPPIEQLQSSVDALLPGDPDVVVVHTVGGRQTVEKSDG